MLDLLKPTATYIFPPLFNSEKCVFSCSAIEFRLALNLSSSYLSRLLAGISKNGILHLGRKTVSIIAKSSLSDIFSPKTKKVTNVDVH